MAVKLRSIVQCPRCGFKVTEKMPLHGQQKHWECPACHHASVVPDGVCCVFCAWGSVPCPTVQQQEPE